MDESDRRPSTHPADSTRDVAGEEFLFHLYRGSELLQDSRVHEAKEELEQALLLQPRDPKGQDLLAVVYFRIGLYPRAIQIYEQLKKDNAESTSIRLNLALCYLKTGQATHARDELEHVLRTNPEHRRAWGYLGLAYERLGDFAKAEGAFERGGHRSMSRRMAERAQGIPATGPISMAVPSAIVPAHGGTGSDDHDASAGGGAPRAAAADAQAADGSFQELDAGELSLAIAEPAVRRTESGTWHAVELGAAVRTAYASGPPVSEREAGYVDPAVVTAFPPATAEHARLRSAMLEESVTAVMAMPTSSHGASPGGAGALRAAGGGALNAVTAPAPGRAVHDSRTAPVRRTLPPFARVTAGARVGVDTPSGMAIDATGLLLLALRGDDPGPRREFAARLEGLRAYAGAVTASVLERRGRGVAPGAAFGGVSGALQRLSGEAVVTLAPRPARHVVAFTLAEPEPLFVKEELLLAFDVSLAYENGRLARTNENDEAAAIVQLRGVGAVALELLEPLRALTVSAACPVTARLGAILGWTGRLVPRELPPGEALAGQRGLFELTGEGTVIVSGLGATR